MSKAKDPSKISDSLKNVHSFLRGKVTPGRITSVQKDPYVERTGISYDTYVPSQDKSRVSATSEALSREASSEQRDTEEAQDAAGTDTQRQQQPGASASGMGTPAPYVPSVYRSLSDERVKKFLRVLDADVVNLEELRNLAWNGIPPHLRSQCWKLLLGYTPAKRDRRQRDLAKKRHEYSSMVPEYYDIDASARTEEEVAALRQVAVDAPRTAPEVPFFHDSRVQRSLERLLYIWGIRHPASGYVQGINDLVTPFLAVFLGDFFSADLANHGTWDVGSLSEAQLIEVEADAYWCLCKLLDGIQDHYTYAQPGIQRTIYKLQELIKRIDEPLTAHLSEQGVELMQFGFRWVNCLLIREVSFDLAIRLWDTYVAEGSNLAEFLTYVCASFLGTWAPQIMEMEFQDLMLFLQRLPTSDWTEKDLESVLSQAFMWRTSFDRAKAHIYNN